MPLSDLRLLCGSIDGWGGESRNVHPADGGLDCGDDDGSDMDLTKGSRGLSAVGDGNSGPGGPALPSTSSGKSSYRSLRAGRNCK